MEALSVDGTWLADLDKLLRARKAHEPAFVMQLTAQLRSRPVETLYELLLDREISVLCAIAQGEALAQIAGEMHLSARPSRRIEGECSINCICIAMPNWHDTRSSTA